jgi:hypothetical protein
MQGAWMGVFGGTGVRIFRIVNLNFREFIFHALGCIRASERAGALRLDPY